MKMLGEQIVFDEKRRSDPSHMIAIGAGGDRTQPSWKHFMTLPKCRKCHTEFESTPKLEEFEVKYQVDLFQMAARLEAEFLYQLSEGIIEL